LGRAQKLHLPSQALSQQTPSTQKPDAHSPAPPQDWPMPLGPQLPAWQLAGARHWLSSAHDPRQAPCSQTNGAQDRAVPATQLPCSLQTLAGLRLAPVHDAGWQMVPAG
jgi:hypothetical protein